MADNTNNNQADNIIKRMHFFDGLFLTQEEFNIEQDYHIMMRRQHNAYFHGVGVIEGLEVEMDGSGSRSVKVQPGAAINKQRNAATGNEGQEIILVNEETVNFDTYNIPSDYNNSVYICISYKEETDIQDQSKGGETDINWLEKPTITCTTSIDDLDDSLDLVLAKITLTNGVVQNNTDIDNSIRRKAGFFGKVLKITDDADIGGDLNVTGNLKVEGEFEKELMVKDDIIVLNKGDGGNPTSDKSGLEIFRGSINGNEPAQLIWDESDDRWKVIIGSTEYNLVYGPDINVDLASGNLGVGTSTPSAKLSINGGLHVGGDSDPGNDNLEVDGSATIGSNLTVGGNLTVDGDTTLNTQNLVIEDDIFTLNKKSDGTQTSKERSGIEIYRGTETPAYLVWDEKDSLWKVSIGDPSTSKRKYDLVYGPEVHVSQLTGSLGVGTSTPLAKLSINGGLHVGGDSDPGDNNIEVDGTADIKGDVTVGDSTRPANLTANGNLIVKRTASLEDANFAGNAKISGDFTVAGYGRVKGNFTVDGNLTVNGETTTVNAATLDVEDNIIVANRFKPDTAPNPNSLSGIEIFRGQSGKPAQVVWDENDDQWKIGVAGALVPLATVDQLSTGVSKDIYQVDHGFKPGLALYYSPKTRRYELALSSSEYTVGLFIVSKIIDSNNFTLVQAGYIEGLKGLIPGEYYYVSDKEPGALTTIEPATISNPLFLADSDTSGYVLPYRPSALDQLPGFSGMTKDIYQVDHGFKPGLALYYSPKTKKYELALSSSEYTVGLFIVSKIIDSNNFTLVQAGYIEGLKGLIPGEYYYVSDKESGVLTTIEPATISNPLFLADSDTSGYVLPYRPSALEQIPLSPWVQDSESGNITFMKGNVGIGSGFDTTLPDRLLHLGIHNKSGSLRIEGSADGSGQPAISIGPEGEVIVDGVNSPAERFIIQQNGNVGINIPKPIYTLHTNGISYAEKHVSGGTDYAEYFESTNGKEITPGTSVVLEKGKVRKAKNNEIPIGIISANSMIIGGVHPEWPHKYLRDAFGAIIMEKQKEEIMVAKQEKVIREIQKVKKKKVEEEVTRIEIVKIKDKYCQVKVTEKVKREVEEPVFEEVDLYDEKGKKVIGRHRIPVTKKYEEETIVLDDNGNPVMVGSGKFETRERPKLNPEYDEKKDYVPREKRPEWNCVGLLGQLPLRKGQPVAPTWIKIKDLSKDAEIWLVK